ncbi:MAG: hypothetical protein ACR2J8_11555, partial [Thermomicrobiales bacterium]
GTAMDSPHPRHERLPRATRRRLAQAALAATVLAAPAGATFARRGRRRAAANRQPAARTANALIETTTDRGAMVRIESTVPVSVEVCVTRRSGQNPRCEQTVRREDPRRVHRIPVTGLLPDTTYRYIVTTAEPDDAGADPGSERPSKVPGVIKQSDLHSAPEDVDGTAPDIEAGPQAVVAGEVVGVRWETSIYSNGRVDYQPNPRAPEASFLTADQQFEIPRYGNLALPGAQTTDHRVCLRGLTREEVYGYSVTSVTGSSPVTSPDKTMVTPAVRADAASDFVLTRQFNVDV